MDVPSWMVGRGGDQHGWEIALIDELKFTPAFICTTFLVEEKRDEGKGKKSNLRFFMAHREEQLSEQELLLPFPALYKPSQWNGLFLFAFCVLSAPKL